MVEAGANEIPEAEILDALDIAHDAIKKLCAAQDELREKAGKEKTAGRGAAGRSRLYEQIKASHGAALDAATQVEDKLERQDATKAVEEQVLDAVLGRPRGREYAEYRGNAAAGVRQAREDDDPRADRDPEEASRRPHARGDPSDLDRGLGGAAHARLRAVHARPDAGASASPPWARRGRRCASTRSGWRRPSATSTTTTSRRSASGRRASCAAPSAATSATARSPSGRWSR